MNSLARLSGLRCIAAPSSCLQTKKCLCHLCRHIREGERDSQVGRQIDTQRERERERERESGNAKEAQGEGGSVIVKFSWGLRPVRLSESRGAWPAYPGLPLLPVPIQAALPQRQRRLEVPDHPLCFDWRSARSAHQLVAKVFLVCRAWDSRREWEWGVLSPSLCLPLWAPTKEAVATSACLYELCRHLRWSVFTGVAVRRQVSGRGNGQRRRSSSGGRLSISLQCLGW